MKKTIALLFFQFILLSLFSQNLKSARAIIDTLTTPYFSGRSAVNDGEKKAANYIATAFKSYGLKQFDSTFFQEFTYPLNTFEGVLTLSIDNKQLIAGEDYLVDASSGKISGTFPLIWYNKENVPTKKQLKKLVARNFFINKFVVIDDEGAEKEQFMLLKNNSVEAAGIIFIENKKLTQHLSATYNDYGILRILRESIVRDCKTINVEINNTFIANYQSQNVIGYVQGSEYPDSFIILSAHYDHLGTMGKDVYFPGANDNASGIAMLLNFSEHYAKNPPKKTIVLIAFGGEEAGLRGSKYYTEKPLFSLNKINFVFNMDLMGTGSKGATIVNGAIFTHHYEKLLKTNEKKNYLTVIKKRGKAANSDHYWFSEKGVPAFFMYLMGGPSAYHDIYDVSNTLPLTEFEDCFLLIRDFVDTL